MGRKRRGQPVHGWIAVDKDIGLTSTQVVGRVRRLFDAQKAGHAGTLDPLATGVLPIALGEATKTVPYVMNGAKAYRFTACFGEARDTDDLEGRVIAVSDVRPDDVAIRAVLGQHYDASDELLMKNEFQAYILMAGAESSELAGFVSKYRNPLSKRLVDNGVVPIQVQ